MSVLIELSRRRLLQTGVLGGIGAAVLTACGETAEVIKEVPAKVVTEVQVAGKTVVREVPVEVMKNIFGDRGDVGAQRQGMRAGR